MSDQPLANVRLERTILGRMLTFEHHYSRYVGAGLCVEDFYRAGHRPLFEAIGAVEQRGEEVNTVSVRNELRRVEQLEAIGGDDYLLGLCLDVLPAPEAAPALEVSELGTLAAKRLFIKAAPSADFDELAALVERASSRAKDPERIYDSSGQLGAVESDTARDAGGRVWLGIPTLDNMLEGLRAGEVFGLMARPGIGKTLALCHVTRAVADQEGVGHVFFSLEMPAPQIVDRLAGAHYGLSRTWFRERLSSGALDADDYRQAFRRFVLVDAPGLSVAQMAAKLRQIQAGALKGIPIRLVTMDHLGLVGGDRKMTTYDRVSTQAREIKELAKRFNCTVILAVQVNREQGGDGSKELGLGAARDSGVVEEAMDYLVAMRRLDRSQSLQAYEREKYRDVLFCKVVKNRHGAPDTEVAVRIETPSLRLVEDPTMVIDQSDVTKIAAMPLRGGRR